MTSPTRFMLLLILLALSSANSLADAPTLTLRQGDILPIRDLTERLFAIEVSMELEAYLGKPSFFFDGEKTANHTDTAPLIGVWLEMPGGRWIRIRQEDEKVVDIAVRRTFGDFEDWESVKLSSEVTLRLQDSAVLPAAIKVGDRFAFANAAMFRSKFQRAAINTNRSWSALPDGRYPITREMWYRDPNDHLVRLFAEVDRNASSPSLIVTEIYVESQWSFDPTSGMIRVSLLSLTPESRLELWQWIVIIVTGVVLGGIVLVRVTRRKRLS